MRVRGGCIAVLAGAVLAAGPARGETLLEPVLKLGLEGGYDSNVLFDGRSDARSRVSPELGVRLRDPLWDVAGAYGVDYLSYARLQPGGVWNHRATADLVATPGPLTTLRAALRSTYATDPLGLAQAGIFRQGQTRALFLQLGGRADHDLSRTLVLGAELTERLVRFEDRTGGAMHAPSVELLRRLDERFLVGAAYAFSVFQDLDPARNTLAYANGVRARARYHITRFLEADAFAGPALWSGPDGRATVPEGALELRLVRRDWDLRATVAHRLGLGSTAAPSLVDSAEVGTVRRFGRRFDLRGDAGFWITGDVPGGGNATSSFALEGEAGWHVSRELRLAVAASQLARLDDSSSRLRRTTVGIRLGWELSPR